MMLSISHMSRWLLTAAMLLICLGLPCSAMAEYRISAKGKTIESRFRGQTWAADLPLGGKVVLDFNKAYNPPCAFTPYATCPLPPPQNWMPVRVEAGELSYGKGH